MTSGSNETVVMSPIIVYYDRFGADVSNHGMLSRYVEISIFDSDANQLLSNKTKFIYDSYPHIMENDLGNIPGTNIDISQLKGPSFVIDSIGALP